MQNLFALVEELTQPMTYDKVKSALGSRVAQW